MKDDVAKTPIGETNANDVALMRLQRIFEDTAGLMARAALSESGSSADPSSLSAPAGGETMNNEVMQCTESTIFFFCACVLDASGRMHD